MRVWLALIAFAAACGRFSAEGGGGPTSTPTNDAGAKARDADAESDASPLIEDAAMRPCDFCEDWETESSARWAVQQSNGSAQRSMVEKHSGQWSLESQTDDTDQGRAVFSHRLDTTKRKGTLSVWVYLQDWTGNTPITVFELGMVPDDGTRASVQLTGSVEGGDLKYKLLTQRGGDSHSSSGDHKLDAPTQVWTKLTLDFDVNASKMTLTRGEPPDAKSFDETTIVYGPDFEISGYDIRVGLNVITESPSARLYIDDVSLSLE